MNIINECITRKIDNVGRVSIPKHLRDKFKMHEGDFVDVYTAVDENNKPFVCFALAESKQKEE